MDQGGLEQKLDLGILVGHTRVLAEKKVSTDPDMCLFVRSILTSHSLFTIDTKMLVASLHLQYHVHTFSVCVGKFYLKFDLE